MTGLVAFADAPALSQSCTQDIYDHNGSLMAVETCGDSVIVRYAQPRSGLLAVGVGAGTILFHGTLAEMAGGGELSGTAYVFKRGCTPAGYPVEGWKIGETMALEGQAPVRGDNCRVARYRRDLLDFSRR